MSAGRYFPDDDYHPHYPSKDGDYYQRLMDGAAKMANPFRLMCFAYTEEQEAAVERFWLCKNGNKVYEKK